MKFVTCTQIIPVINVGMYDTTLAPSSIFENAYDPETDDWVERPDEDWDKFDGSLYKSAVGKEAAKLVNPLFNGFAEKYGIMVTSSGTISSPRYYNFETDELNLELDTCADFIDKALANIERFKSNKRILNFINDNWVSCDGFDSYMPQDIEALEAEIKGMRFNSIPADRIIAGYAALCAIETGLIPDKEADEYDYLESIDYHLYNAMCDYEFEDFCLNAEAAD